MKILFLVVVIATLCYSPMFAQRILLDPSKNGYTNSVSSQSFQTYGNVIGKVAEQEAQLSADQKELDRQMNLNKAQEAQARRQSAELAQRDADLGNQLKQDQNNLAVLENKAAQLKKAHEEVAKQLKNVEQQRAKNLQMQTDTANKISANQDSKRQIAKDLIELEKLLDNLNQKGAEIASNMDDIAAKKAMAERALEITENSFAEAAHKAVSRMENQIRHTPLSPTITDGDNRDVVVLDLKCPPSAEVVPCPA